MNDGLVPPPENVSPAGRLIVVSNRVTPVTGKRAAQAGGLAVGVLAALKNTGGVWFGWSGDVVSNDSGSMRKVSVGRVTYALMDLNKDDFELYYAGFANRTLWPLFHYRLDLTSFHHEWYNAYRKVNQIFASRIIEEIGDDDVVWVHDYHLIPLASELRRLGSKARIGFFLHIPFPPTELFVTLPWHRQLAGDLCAYDVVGFQTGTDVRHFGDYVELEINGVNLRNRRFKAVDREFIADMYPIGIDPDDFRSKAQTREANREAKRLEKVLVGRKLIIGVDRLDYTKGIPERLTGFQTLLAEYPVQRSAVSFMQISAPSREDVPEYNELRSLVETMAGHLNGQYSEADWVPLRYINRSYSQRALAGFFKLAHVGLVTPLRDGMNLVAFEFVAAQDPDDPGVLVLSRFAGCAAHLDGALIVNPHDAHHMADTMHAALEMTLDERQDRFDRMMAAVSRNNIFAWRDRFLGDLVLSEQNTDQSIAAVNSFER